MANFKGELRSGYNRLRGLREDLYATAWLGRRGWDELVLAKRSLGPEERIEHGFLAEHFLVTWANWQGLLDRSCRYFGQPEDKRPKTWAQLSTKCEVLAFALARDRELDQIIARSWITPGGHAYKQEKRPGHDVASFYSEVVQGHERADAIHRAERVAPRFAAKEAALAKMVPDRVPLPEATSVVERQNEGLVERWRDLPWRIQDQVSGHLRHYLHSTMSVSWLVDPAVRSALLAILWRKEPMSVVLKETVGPSPSDSRTSDAVERLLDRLKAAIAELGYEAVLDDLLDPELIGGQADSLLPAQDVTVVPGLPNDTTRPVLLAVTKGWHGKDALSFTRVTRQVKARLTEARGAVKLVIVFCDCWDSASFQEEHGEELAAHARNGVQFQFLMVGVPDRVLVPVPVEFAHTQS
jgi:hypothetical protein